MFITIIDSVWSAVICNLMYVTVVRLFGAVFLQEPIESISTILDRALKLLKPLASMHALSAERVLQLVATCMLCIDQASSATPLEGAKKSYAQASAKPLYIAHLCTLMFEIVASIVATVNVAEVFLVA